MADTPIKTVFVLPNIKGGGAERVTVTLLSHLDNNRFSTTLILLRKTGVYWDELQPCINMLEMSQENQRIRDGIKDFWKKARPYLQDCDVIVGAEELDATYYAYLFGKYFKKPVIGWVHSPIQRYLESVPKHHRYITRFLYPQLNSLVFPSNGAALSMQKILGKSQSRYSIIGNPVDITAIRRKAALDIPESLQTAFAKPVILGIGRLEISKGFDILIRAHAEVLHKGYDHHLLILGEGRDRKVFENMVKEHHIEGSVFMPGFISNPYSLIQNSKLLVHPSRYEGFGMAVVEAMALGVPVIAGQSDGVESILDRGKYGVVVPGSDVNAVANAIYQLCTQPLMHGKFVQSGLERAADYSVEKIVEEWGHLLYQVSSLG